VGHNGLQELMEQTAVLLKPKGGTKKCAMLWNDYDYDFIKVKSTVLHLFNSPSTHHWSTWSESAKPQFWVPARV